MFGNIVIIFLFFISGISILSDDDGNKLFAIWVMLVVIALVLLGK